jgi:hypothetical protein
VMTRLEAFNNVMGNVMEKSDSTRIESQRLAV